MWVLPMQHAGAVACVPTWLNHVHVHVSRDEAQTAQQQTVTESNEFDQTNGEADEPHRHRLSSSLAEVYMKQCC